MQIKNADFARGFSWGYRLGLKIRVRGLVCLHHTISIVGHLLGMIDAKVLSHRVNLAADKAADAADTARYMLILEHNAERHARLADRLDLN